MASRALRLGGLERLPRFLPFPSLFHPSSFSSSSPARCRRRLSTVAGDEFSGQSAYQVLGVSETSSFSEIKSSFRKLAKETHPDVAPSASRRFLQILAAYEILSDSNKRTHYDSYLLSQRKVLQKQTGSGGTGLHTYRYSSYVTMAKQMEVVEWLKWYRVTVDDIVSHRRVAASSGYLGELENELYCAIRVAYYGPVVESMDLLPDCFEAEERSGCQTPEVLQLVYGRDLLGIVYVVDKVPELSYSHFEMFPPTSTASDMCNSVWGTSVAVNFGSKEDFKTQDMQVSHSNENISDAYKDLELHISGRVIAMATRTPPRSHCDEDSSAESEDHIYVFLGPNEDQEYVSKEVSADSRSASSVGSRIFLGTIRALGTSPEEGSCSVHDKSGVKTHVIMKHRTLLVKHMHWYQIGDDISTCECRCSRARLPPSRFWLFEPRSCMHDIGGWYIETFGRDKKGMTVPSQRQWHGTNECHEKRLHPAMYLAALAYRTLDLEDVKRKKLTVRGIIEPTVSSILRWCKKFV